MRWLLLLLCACDPAWEVEDRDADGWTWLQGDCDDDLASVHPGQIELCDGLDNDCDGLTDGANAFGAQTWYADGDGDGYGDPDNTVLACDLPEGASAEDRDCDDQDPEIHPGATEIEDGYDNDCDGSVDE